MNLFVVISLVIIMAQLAWLIHFQKLRFMKLAELNLATNIMLRDDLHCDSSRASETGREIMRQADRLANNSN